MSFDCTILPTSLLNRRPPVAPSFVARRKIGEKGLPKGSKPALWILAFYTGVRRGDVRRPYEFARVQLTRFRPARRRAGGVRFTRLRRKARHHLFSAISLPKALLPPDSIVLHELRRMRKTFRISSVVCNRKSGGCVSFAIILGPVPQGYFLR